MEGRQWPARGQRDHGEGAAAGCSRARPFQGSGRREHPDYLQHQEERQSDTKQRLQKRTLIVAKAVATHTHDCAPNELAPLGGQIQRPLKLVQRRCPFVSSGNQAG